MLEIITGHEIQFLQPYGLSWDFCNLNLARCELFKKYVAIRNESLSTALFERYIDSLKKVLKALYAIQINISSFWYCKNIYYSKTSILEYQLVSGKWHSRIEYYSKIEVIYFIKINFGLQQNPFLNRCYSKNLYSRGL